RATRPRRGEFAKGSDCAPRIRSCFRSADVSPAVGRASCPPPAARLVLSEVERCPRQPALEDQRLFRSDRPNPRNTASFRRYQTQSPSFLASTTPALVKIAI